MYGLMLHRMTHLVRVLIAATMAVFVTAHRHQQAADRHRDHHKADKLACEFRLGETLQR